MHRLRPAAPKMGSVSAAIQSLMHYMETKFDGLHKRIDLQDRQMGVMGTELQQITKSIGRLEQADWPSGWDHRYCGWGDDCCARST